MHPLPFQYVFCVGFIFRIKAARFKALKQQHPVIVIILPLEQEQFGFGGGFLFFDVSSVKAIPAALLWSPFVQSRFCSCRGSRAGEQRPPFPGCIPGRCLYLLPERWAVPWKALHTHTGVAAISRQGVLQGNKWEQRPRRAKSWRTQFISFIHWMTELLNWKQCYINFTREGE